MKNKILITLFVLLCAVGCARIATVTVENQKYRLISKEKKNPAGPGVIVEMWERVDPPDTNFFYTPTLFSIETKQNPPDFIKIQR